MKIVSVKYANHPILGNLELNFENSDTNQPYSTILLAGENGVGKSTILKTINEFLCAGPITPFAEIVYEVAEGRFRVGPMENATQNWYHRRKDLTTNEEKDIKRNNNFDPQGMLEDKKDPRSYGSVISNARSDFKTDRIQSSSSKELDVDLHDKDSVDNFTSLKQLLIDIGTQDNEEYSRINQELEATGHQILTRTEFDARHSKINRFKKAFNDFFDYIKFYGIVTKAGNKVIEFKKGDKVISIDDLSTGEKQIVFRGAHLLKNLSKLNGAIIFIDEPELSMHPLWQQKILDYYRGLFTENGNQIAQIIIASHSEGVLKEALHTQDTLVLTLRQDANGQAQPAFVRKPTVLNFDCDAEVSYQAFGTSSTDYHNALYGYIEAEGWLAEYNRGKTTYPYTKLHKDGRTTNHNYIKSEIIRHQIHHPENTRNTLYTPEELAASIEAMRNFIENHP